MERNTKRGRVFWLRFTAYGQRRSVTLGTRADGWTQERAERELADTLTLVRKGIWRPPTPEPVPVVNDDPTFHMFASEWLEAKRQEGLGERTLIDYEWALSYHLLPFFQGHRLSQITVQEVDRYKLTKSRERADLDKATGGRRHGRAAWPCRPTTTNKTITRLAQILDVAVEYGHLTGNPAIGKRRRLRGQRPQRRFVQPEQVLALLRASDGCLGVRGRPLLATLVGAGLRIQEALDLERRHVNLARGTLTVQKSKTDAGVRVVDLTPALRDELAVWLDRSPFKQPTDRVFPTSTGAGDSRQNVRRRLLVRAVEKANVELERLGIELIGSVPLHGLRRTYATLRVLAGDDVVYVSKQIGHEQPGFTLSVYAQAVTHREKLSDAERGAYDEAMEWAAMGATVDASFRHSNGTNGGLAVPVTLAAAASETTKPPV